MNRSEPLQTAIAANDCGELHRLVAHWDTLSDVERFRLAWEALDKLGAHPTIDDIELARVIELARERGLPGIPSRPTYRGPVASSSSFPPPKGTEPIACLICRTTVNVNVLTLRSTNGLNVEHHLCPAHFDRWCLEAGEIIGRMCRERDNGIELAHVRDSKGRLR